MYKKGDVVEFTVPGRVTMRGIVVDIRPTARDVPSDWVDIMMPGDFSTYRSLDKYVKPLGYNIFDMLEKEGVLMSPITNPRPTGSHQDTNGT